MKELKSSPLLSMSLLFVFTLFVFTPSVFNIMASSNAFTTGGASTPREAKPDDGAGLSPESSVHQQYLKGGAFEGFSPRDEIVSRRTLTAKHFRESEGKGTAIINSGSIHYADDEGLFRDIDTRVTASSTGGFAFENATNNLRSYFSAEDLGNNGVRVHAERGAITIALDPSIVWTDEAGNTETVETGGRSSPIADEDKVTYFKLLPSADNEFVVDYDKLKNNLILKRLPDELIGKSGMVGYSEFIELPAGWSLSSEGQKITAEARIDGGLVVADEQGRAVFTFPAPEVYESTRSSDIREAAAKSAQAYYVVKADGSRIQLITNVSLSWLSAGERAFPVVIDPTVILTFQDAGNWRYSCSGCSCPTCNPPIPPPASYNPGRPPEPYNSYNHSGESAAGWFTWDVSSIQNRCITSVELSYVRQFCIPGINVVGVNYVPLAPADSAAFANALIDDSRRVGTLQFPSNLSVPQDQGQCTALVTYQLPTVSDNCPGVGTPVCNPPSGSTFPLGTSTVSCTVSDAAANSSSCSFTVTVNDTVVPVLTCPGNIVTSTAPNLCSAVVSYTVNATDNCSSLTVVSSPASGSVFPKGTTTVAVTATDAAGNRSDCTFTVTINDTQPPAIVCPASITVANDPDQCSAVVSYAPPVVGDNCPGISAPICNPHSGSTFAKGTTIVTCSVTDLSGNMSGCMFSVTVNDTQPPAITCPPNMIVTAINPGDTTVIASYPPPAVSDNCAVSSVVCNPPSGSAFPIGVTVVTCSVIDTSSNVKSCTFSMSVYDVCLEDDSLSSKRLLFNSFTGDYRFDCGGASVMGRGTISKKGGEISLTHILNNRRVLGKVSSSTKQGSATLEYPFGTKCFVLDRNITNNSCGSILAAAPGG